jgi:quercetin dioxygenase-like cupin family protein
MKMRAIAGLIGMTAVAAWSQTAVKFYDTAPIQNDFVNVNVHYTTPLENDASRVVRLSSLTYLPGSQLPFHRHFGDQWNTVVEGEVTFTVKGQPPRTLKVGDTIYLPRGTVHGTRNLTDKPAHTNELLIMNKNKPSGELVTE